MKRPPGPRSWLPCIVWLSLSAMACSSGSPSDAPGSTSMPSAVDVTAPPPSDAPSPSASAVAPSLSFAFEAEPVVTREQTGVDERYINPGAVIDDGGTLHMFANLFTAWPGPVAISHLTSRDGVAWELAQPNPVLTSDDVPFTNSGADVSTGFITPDGSWVLIFETVETSRPWVLGRATAPGPDGPWTVDPEPVLQPGPTGAWDAGGLSWPSVVSTDVGWAIYYTGLDRLFGKGSIGRATSADGVAWTKDAEPVLRAQAAWERSKVDRPRVVRTDQGYLMVYAGGRLTDRGLAWSTDGVTWRRDGDLPVIEATGYPIKGQAWDAALIERDGRLLYYLEIGSASGTTGTQVYLASSRVP